MITFYRSNYNEFDAGSNGGDITTVQIESGVANSMLPPVRPRMAEVGGERWFKFFVKTDEDILTVGIDIAKSTTCPTEEVYFAKETKSDHSDVESDLDKDNIRLFGGFNVDSIDVDNLQVTSDRDVNNFIKADDWVTFYDTDSLRLTGMFVDSVSDDGLTITFKKWTDKDMTLATTGASSPYFASLNADDYIGIWVKETVLAYTDAMEDPLNQFNINVWYDKK